MRVVLLRFRVLGKADRFNTHLQLAAWRNRGVPGENRTREQGVCLHVVGEEALESPQTKHETAVYCRISLDRAERILVCDKQAVRDGSTVISIHDEHALERAVPVRFQPQQGTLRRDTLFTLLS